MGEEAIEMMEEQLMDVEIEDHEVDEAEDAIAELGGNVSRSAIKRIFIDFNNTG